MNIEKKNLLKSKISRIPLGFSNFPMGNKKIIMGLIAVVLIVGMGFFVSAQEACPTTVRVGVFENPPKIFTDENGNYVGFHVDVIEDIANKEGWIVEYVHGHFNEGLDKTEKGDIDIMVDVAWSEPRAERFAFNNEAVFINWASIYAKKGFRPTLFKDLEGKTLAGLEGGIHSTGPYGFIQLAKSFRIDIDYILVQDYADVLAAVDEGKADAGAVNRIFGNTYWRDYDIEETPITFNPIEARYALPKNGTHTACLIEKLDVHLRELREDKQSIYYKSIDKYMKDFLAEVKVTPPWVKWVLILVSSLLIVSLGFTIFIRHQTKRVKQSEVRLAQIIEGYSIPTFAINKNHLVTHWNKAMEQLSKVPKKEMIGTSNPWAPFYEKKRPIIADLIIEPDADKKIAKYYKGKYRKSKLIEGVYEAEGYFPKIKKQLFFTAIPIRDMKENITGALETVQDITARKVAEEKVKVRTAELEKEKIIAVEGEKRMAGMRTATLSILEDVDEARKDLAKSNRLKDLFMDIMRHDLLNPAGIVRMNSQLALEGEKDIKKRKLLAPIERNSNRMIRMIRNASILAKLESGEKIDFKDEDLGIMLKGSVEELGERAKEKNMKVRLYAEGKFPAVVNPLIQNVFSNFLSNAIKYSPEKTEIVAGIKKKNEDWLIYVEDRGEGIPAKYKKAIFERFTRLEKGAVKGSGLGLAISKKIAEAHNGRIWVRDHKGGGSVFYVLVPKARKGVVEPTVKEVKGVVGGAKEKVVAKPVKKEKLKEKKR